MTRSISAATIEKLRSTFAVFGLPQTVVTDNGPCFTSTEIRNFMKCNGIVHVKTAPYHPASNGPDIQRWPQVHDGWCSIKTRVSRFLFKYRTTTGLSPAEMLSG